MAEDGWWHGSTVPLTSIRPFLHAGTMAQAQMRGGRGCHMTRLRIDRGRTVRRRDIGSWRESDLRKIAARGVVAVVYLNRFEGIPLEEFDAARAACADIDRLTDTSFRRLLPSASDSLVILDPSSVSIWPVAG